MQTVELFVHLVILYTRGNRTLAVTMNSVHHNLTLLVAEVDDVAVVREAGTRYKEQEQYDRFLADVWVGIVLTLMVLSCVCCVCSCLLYHRFQQWKRSALESHAQSTAAGGTPGGDVESLPSYNVVSGLPTYNEALEQLRQVQELGSDTKTAEVQAQHTQNNPTDNDNRQQPPLATLTVTEFMQEYKSTTAI